MSRDLSYKYRIVIHIVEDEYWDEQEMLTSNEWDSFAEAAAEADEKSTDMGKYPVGSFIYIESMGYSPWGRVQL